MPNEQNELHDGAFQTARKLFESDVWLYKPAQWAKIWIYIFGHVNHKSQKGFVRGEGYFNFSNEIRRIGIDVSYDQIRSLIKYAKLARMITATKTTRGIRIKVINYEKYQTLDNYRTATETATKTTSKPQQNRNRTAMINKNEKNEKNVKNRLTNTVNLNKDISDTNLATQSVADSKEIAEAIDAFKTTGLNPEIKFGNTTQCKVAGELIKKYGLEKILNTIKYAASIANDQYAPTITTPLELQEKLGKLIKYNKSHNPNNNYLKVS